MAARVAALRGKAFTLQVRRVFEMRELLRERVFSRAAVRWSRVVLVVAVLACVLGLGSRALAKPFDLAGRDWEGCGDFVDLAKAELGQSVIATNELDFHELRPEDGVILLYPESSVDSEALSKFMRAGGRVILLDDFGEGESLLSHFSMERVPIPQHPAESLRHNRDLAIAEPASLHPVVAEASRIVTNHPTGLRHPDLSPVLKIRGAGEPDVVIAVAGAVGQGRLLVVGDPSIVMNSMLRYAGNKALARGMLRYAVEDDTWGKRGGRLYIASGAFKQKGAYGDEDFLSNLKERLRSIQSAFSAMRKEGMPPWVLYGMAVTLGLAVVVWIGARAGRVHKPVTPRFVRDIPVLAQGGMAGHAAVIGSPGASRMLAMLELKYALEENLAVLLDHDAPPSQDVLMRELEIWGLLDASSRASLRALLARFASIETMLMFGKGDSLQRISDAEVLVTGRTVKELLAAATAAAQRKKAGGVTLPEPRAEGAT